MSYRNYGHENDKPIDVLRGAFDGAVRAGDVLDSAARAMAAVVELGEDVPTELKVAIVRSLGDMASSYAFGDSLTKGFATQHSLKLTVEGNIQLQPPEAGNA